jgi:hypothetical protein
MTEHAPAIQNTLEQALIKSIEGIQKTGTELVDALYQQAPEVVEQLLLWHGIESLIHCIAAILFLVLPFIHYRVASHLYQKLGVKDWRDESGFWIPTVVSGVVVFSFVISGFFIFMNLKWLKIWLAPKVYLLEYLADLVK